MQRLHVHLPVRCCCLTSTSLRTLLQVVEHWNSTGCNLRSSNTAEGAGATAAGGEQRVSILPLDQWAPTSLTMRMRITSKRANFDGEWATRVLIGGLPVCV